MAQKTKHDARGRADNSVSEIPFSCLENNNNGVATFLPAALDLKVLTTSPDNAGPIKLRGGSLVLSHMQHIGGTRRLFRRRAHFALFTEAIREAPPDLFQFLSQTKSWQNLADA